MRGISYGVLTGLLFAADWVLKEKADRLERAGKWRTYSDGRVAVWKYHNYGAFYNLGQGNGALVRAISVGLCAVAAVLLLHSLGVRGNGMRKAGLSILLGGAFSNTYDRLTKKYVVDYIQFPKVPLVRKVIFNLSDCCILSGAMLSVFSCLGESGEHGCADVMR